MENTICPQCGIDQNHYENEEENNFHIESLKEHGICSACQLENEQNIR